MFRLVFLSILGLVSNQDPAFVLVDLTRVNGRCEFCGSYAGCTDFWFNLLFIWSWGLVESGQSFLGFLAITVRWARQGRLDKASALLCFSPERC